MQSVSDIGAKAFAEVLTCNSTLIKMQLWGVAECFVLVTPPIDGLFAGNNAITDVGARAIATALQRSNAVVTEIDLR